MICRQNHTKTLVYLKHFCYDRHLFTHLSPYSPKWFVDKTIVPITIVFTHLGMILNLNCRHLVISTHSSNHCALFSSNRSWMWTMDIWFIRQTIVHYSIQLQSIQDVKCGHFSLTIMHQFFSLTAPHLFSTTPCLCMSLLLRKMTQFLQQLIKQNWR